MTRVCVFRIGDQRFGAPTAGVREVVEIHHLAPVPSTPPHLLGVGNLRGQALPVLDLRPVAGLPAPAGARPLALTVTACGDTLALAIDEVSGFDRVPDGGLTPLGDEAAPALARCALGRCETRLGSAVLLDLERLWNELKVGRTSPDPGAAPAPEILITKEIET